jgi:hypothetical protein
MDTATLLESAGFRPVGKWRLDSKFDVRLDADIPTDAGVYAIVVGTEVRYIGAAQRGLHKRFLKYRNQNSTGGVAVRLRGLVKAALANDSVSVLVFVPTASTELSRTGLPLNVIAGLEEGLIQELRPAWNLRGLQFDELKEEAEEDKPS